MTMSECIEDCTECHRACVEVAVHYLAKGREDMARDVVRLLLDVADASSLAADFMSRGSVFYPDSCAFCRDVCLACAEACERTEMDDRHMSRCAEICRHCAESCRRMSLHGRGSSFSER